MAKKKWIEIPGGRVKRWKKSRAESGCKFGRNVPPHWYRNFLNRKERYLAKKAILREETHVFPLVHQHTASWYW